MMKKLILFLTLQVFIPGLSGQDQYLLLTRERYRGTSPSTLAELPLAIAIDIIEAQLPEPEPVEKRIKEGTNVKVRSYQAGKKKIKGKLDILNDSVISIGTSTVLINDIDKIHVRSVFSKVSGPFITGAGVAGTIYMTPFLIESLTLFSGGPLKVLGGMILVPLAAAAVIGCAVVAVSGIIYFINGRVFNTRDNLNNRYDGWQISVVTGYSGLPPGS